MIQQATDKYININCCEFIAKTEIPIEKWRRNFGKRFLNKWYKDEI